VSFFARIGRENGGHSFRAPAAELAASGRTTLNEVMRISQSENSVPSSPTGRNAPRRAGQGCWKRHSSGSRRSAVQHRHHAGAYLMKQKRGCPRRRQARGRFGGAQGRPRRSHAPVRPDAYPAQAGGADHPAPLGAARVGHQSDLRRTIAEVRESWNRQRAFPALRRHPKVSPLYGEPGPSRRRHGLLDEVFTGVDFCSKRRWGATSAPPCAIPPW